MLNLTQSHLNDSTVSPRSLQELRSRKTLQCDKLQYAKCVFS